MSDLLRKAHQNPNNVKISRNLVVNSPKEFYLLIKHNSFDYDFFRPFTDKMELYLEGCSCKAKENWESAIVEYKNLKNLDLTEVKSILQCSTIVFNLEGLEVGKC